MLVTNVHHEWYIVPLGKFRSSGRQFDDRNRCDDKIRPSIPVRHSSELKRDLAMIDETLKRDIAPVRRSVKQMDAVPFVDRNFRKSIVSKPFGLVIEGGTPPGDVVPGLVERLSKQRHPKLPLMARVDWQILSDACKPDAQCRTVAFLEWSRRTFTH
jgi:hypothetical protein